jgi:60 kDa SS-A/Ro ribonucleoprotein
MANKRVFTSTGRRTPDADTVNTAGGKAYKSDSKQALAQIAATNCFNGTYYVSAEANLEIAKQAALALKNDPEFLAKAAIYSRSKAYMKDMPAFIMVVLADADTKLFRKVFPFVIDNGKMLRNFVHIARSGVIGRTFNLSAGAFRKAIQKWFAGRNGKALLKASIGNDPSMRDILRMARPKPVDNEQAAMFAYLKGTEFDNDSQSYKTYDKEGNVRYEQPFSNLPQIVKEYEEFKKTLKGAVPKVDFRLLDSLGMTDEQWTEIARNAPWMMTRMNLNTFARHGVFANDEVASLIAERLRNPEEIAKARAFPYQFMMAWMATDSNDSIPFAVRDALRDAMETAINNVPELPGKVYIAVDTSGSMGCAVTGFRRGSTSNVRCVDVAALFAASVLRKNPDAEVLPFDTRVHATARLNARDTVMTNASYLAKFGGGGTNCSAALAHLNKENAKGSAVIYVSDYESWVDSGWGFAYGRGTGLLSEWKKFKSRNKKAKLICIDLTPRDNSQVKEHEDILQVGGFSDQVFEVITSFIEHGHSKNYWVSEIENINVDEVTVE